MSTPWSLHSRLCDLKTPWFRLLGERLQPSEGQAVDYWRVERAYSVIVVPQQGDRLILPPPQYRPGAGVATWDFPGGRWPEAQSLAEASYAILERELQVVPEAVLSLQPLNPDGWWVNSSFSNQKLYGVQARIAPDAVIPPAAIGAVYLLPSDAATPSDTTITGLDPSTSPPSTFPSHGSLADLDRQLDCLQCRMVLAQMLRA